MGKAPYARCFVASLAMTLAAGAFFAVAAEPAQLRYVPGSTKKVSQLTGDVDHQTGAPAMSATETRFGLIATDLGSSFEHKEKLYFLFGDTWGRPGDRDALLWTSSATPDKIVLDAFKDKDGKWLPLTVPGIKQGAFEIPSGGISIADIMYVVFTTDHSQQKVMGRSVLASSSDDGLTFDLRYELSRDKFINVSFWLKDDWLYIYGSGDYRNSSVYLARIRPNEIGERARLQFYAGVGSKQQPVWSTKEFEAVALFRHNVVGEFSVAYLKQVDRYVMLYNSATPRGILMRTAEQPWGPWSEGSIIFEPWRDLGYGHFIHISAKFKGENDALSTPGREDEWGGEYGPYIMARYTAEARHGYRIYYTMSTWNPYQVVVMQSDLILGAVKQPAPDRQEDHGEPDQ